MKKKGILWALVFVLLAAVLTGCGGSSGSSVMMNSYAADAAAPQEAPMAVEESAYYGEAGTSFVPEIRDSRAKIIYTAELDMETTDFDSAAEALAALTAECGGYYESSSVHNSGSGYRSARYSVRVPAEQYRAFLDQAGALCHTTYFYEEADDVSELYYDIAGRLETQKTKLARLRELLSQAEDMEDLITVESAISETEEQIERLSGQLRQYDALVDYSTVTVYLNEVYRLSNVPEPVQGFGSRLVSALGSGWRGFVSGMETLVIVLAYAWVWLLAAAVITVVVVVLVRRGVKRRAKTPPPTDYTTPQQEKPEE